MESNNFGTVVNVIWEYLLAGQNSVGTSVFPAEGLALVLLGIAGIIATRRYLPTLAGARTLQPASAIELQRAMRSVPPPLSAKRHQLAASNAPTPINPAQITPISGGSSHAA